MTKVVMDEVEYSQLIEYAKRYENIMIELKKITEICNFEHMFLRNKIEELIEKYG